MKERLRKSFTRRGVRLISVLLVVTALVASILPNIAWAQEWPDVEGRYYHARYSFPLYDMNGTFVQYSRGIGIYFATQNDNVVTGEIDAYEA